MPTQVDGQGICVHQSKNAFRNLFSRRGEAAVIPKEYLYDGASKFFPPIVLTFQQFNEQRVACAAVRDVPCNVSARQQFFFMRLKEIANKRPLATVCETVGRAASYLWMVVVQHDPPEVFASLFESNPSKGNARIALGAETGMRKEDCSCGIISRSVPNASKKICR
jgi:hypothetical protein